MIKIKRSHLYIFMVVLFAATFAGLNLKYDRYYRVPGITNEYRSLIDEYLSSDEKKLLIKNCIPVNSFAAYLQQPHFRLANYEYYNQITDYSSYGSMDRMLCVVNEIVETLGNQKYEQEEIQQIFSSITSGDILEDYIQNEGIFNYNYMDIYIEARKYTDDEDYINKVNTIMSYYDETYFKQEEYYSLITELIEDYSLDDIEEIILYKENHPDCNIVLHPADYLTVLNENDYIGNYEPRNLVITEDMPRLVYFTYLTQEAYDNYVEMYNAYLDCTVDGNNQMIIVCGYQSAEDLSLIEDKDCEMQLGNTIHIKEYGYTDERFNETFVREWLKANAYQYGYVQRYSSEDKEYIYRYVGKELAMEMHNQSLTLEDYLNQIS